MNRPDPQLLEPPPEVSVETPERIAFSFEIAGIGSRGLAAIVDGLVLFLLLTFLSGALLMLLRGPLGAASRAWGATLLGLAIYAVVWGYFVYFETRWHGQTPGKRLLGLRVVQDSGVGIGFLEAAIRNVLRVVDFMPAFFSVGLLCMFFNRRAKRLGDFAAGTIVIKEKQYHLRHFTANDDTIVQRRKGRVDRRAELAALSPHETELLALFLDRRKAFAPEVRTRLARALTAPFLRAAGVPEEEIAGLALEDFESWVKARFSAADPAGREPGAARHLTDFVRRKAEGWRRFSALLDRVQGAPWSTISHADLRELGSLYRKTTADYAYARLRFARTDTLLYLNQLVARGHNAVYRRKPITMASVLRFAGTTLPQTFRACFGRFALAAAVFAAAALFGFLATTVNEDVATLFLSRDLIDEHLHNGKLWTEDLISVMPSAIASARILTNNITVALAGFATGLTFGVGTLWLLFLNGMMLGVVGAICAKYGLSGKLWSFVAAHGPLELTGIFLSAAAGLLLAEALIAPGDLRRGDALRLRARQAITLVLGALPILFLAGWIEGFLSVDERLPGWSKALVGATTAAGLFTYLARAGKRTA